MSTSTPERTGTEELRATPEQLNFINLEGVEDYRRLQSEKYDREVGPEIEPAAREQRENEFLSGNRDFTLDYLRAHGVDDDRMAEALANHLESLSIHEIPDSEWYSGNYAETGELDEEGNPIMEEASTSGRDRAREAYANFLNSYSPETNPDTFDDDDATQEVDPAELARQAAEAEAEAQRQRKEQADNYRETDRDYIDSRDKLAADALALAKHGAKRAGHYRSLRSRKKHDELRAGYEEAMTDHARYELYAREIELGRPMTDEESRQFALSYALGAEKGLQIKTNEQMAQSKLIKFVESPAFRYAFAQTFTEGKWAGRAEVAIKGILVGGGVTLLSGAALGTGVVGAAVGSALLALRAGKNYAQIDAARGRALDVIGETETTDARQAAAKSIDQTVDHTGEHWQDTLDRLNVANARGYEAAIIKEQDKRIKSASFALGMTALGGALAYGMAAWYDALEASRADRPSLTNPGPRIEPGGANAPVPSIEDTGESADINLPGEMGNDTMNHDIAGNDNVYQFNSDEGVKPEHQAGYDGGEVHSDGQPYDLTTDAEGGETQVEAKAAAVDTGYEAAPNSLDIYQGQGWNEVMQQLGIPNSEWGQTLQDAGPELRELGYAYWDRDAGNYGILMPANGQLPQSALNILLRHAS